MISIKEKNERYRKKYPEKIKELRKYWRAKDPEYMKRWREKNPEYMAGYLREYHKDKKNKFVSYTKNAKFKGLILGITFDEFVEITNQPCYYCGGEGYGIDRLDSSMGYLKDNIVSCCSMCNYMKQSYREDEFIKRCKKISNNWKRERSEVKWDMTQK